MVILILKLALVQSPNFIPFYHCLSVYLWAVRLLSVSKQAKLEIIAVSVTDRRFRPLARGSEPLTFSPEERIEVTILGFSSTGFIVLPPF